MVNTVQRPLPDIDNPLYRAHFQGLKDEELRVQQCSSCSQLQWPPRDLCKQCHGDRFDWPVMPTQGVVYTSSVVYRAPHPWFKEHAPYAIVVAELENGLRLLESRCVPARVSQGLPANIPAAQHAPLMLSLIVMMVRYAVMALFAFAFAFEVCNGLQVFRALQAALLNNGFCLEDFVIRCSCRFAKQRLGFGSGHG